MSDLFPRKARALTKTTKQRASNESGKKNGEKSLAHSQKKREKRPENSFQDSKKRFSTTETFKKQKLLENVSEKLLYR